jgi:hypothetical protein
LVLACPILSVEQSLTFDSRLKGTSHEMGRRHRRRIWFRPTRREALHHTKHCLDGHRLDLDEVVLCHQTEKYAVSVHTKIPDNLTAPKYPPPPSHGISWYASSFSRLAAVNCCLFIVGTVQVTRILIWRSKQTGSLTGAVKELGNDITSTAKSAESEVVEDAKKAKAEL